MEQLPSTKPYLIRAIWEWCTDHGFTPYIAVQVDARTFVPREFVKDQQIILNLGQSATNQLKMGNDLIEFQARFGGVARELSVPVDQVLAIYARENGAGMSFDLLETVPEEVLAENRTAGLHLAEVVPSQSAPDDEPPPRPEGGRPKLQRIK